MEAPTRWIHRRHQKRSQRWWRRPRVVHRARRGELLALRWTDLDLAERTLTVRESVYEGVFDTPKTEAGRRRMQLSAGGRSRQGRR